MEGINSIQFDGRFNTEVMQGTYKLFTEVKFTAILNIEIADPEKFNTMFGGQLHVDLINLIRGVKSVNNNTRSYKIEIFTIKLDDTRNVAHMSDRYTHTSLTELIENTVKQCLLLICRRLILMVCAGKMSEYTLSFNTGQFRNSADFLNA